MNGRDGAGGGGENEVSEDVLEKCRAAIVLCDCNRGGSPCARCETDAALAAEVRALRKDRERLDAILKRRKAHAWNEELGYSVALENREMVDAWLEWEVSALVGDDAALSARSGEDGA